MGACRPRRLAAGDCWHGFPANRLITLLSNSHDHLWQRVVCHSSGVESFALEAFKPLKIILRSNTRFERNALTSWKVFAETHVALP
jgi:hypothetical protein